MNRSVCIHGHFYQPPRENPWLEAIELQDSAYPYHDWNERITAECYAPNAASRILDDHGRILRIVNNYSGISFNFGPTLLSWLHEHEANVYQAIIDADVESRKRFSGHGSALAQPYNHMIMPLANAADRHTQAIWGLHDFVSRFGREPEGIWLPETAVDLPTLEMIADLGIAFTILAPSQAARVKPIEGTSWRDVDERQIDTTRPYLQRLPSGKTIAIFFYDGAVSRAVAFEGLLKNGETYAQRLLSIFGSADGPQLANIATDGETYGHHHRHGDMALAYALYHIDNDGSARLANYAECLEQHPPEQEVAIHELTSWSCAHGIERWRSDCGCKTGGRTDTSQEWRAPLRSSLDWLRDRICRPYTARAGGLFHDPAAARNDYITVILDRSTTNVDAFFERHAARVLAPDEQVVALKLLELQRHAMLMYTSCGWFFHDLAGIETVQVLRYAGRALQLARETLDLDLEEEFLARLEKAHSNDAAEGNGRAIYERYVRPAAVDLEKVAAHYAVSSLYEATERESQVYCYVVTSEASEKLVSGDAQLIMGRARVVSDITRESALRTYAVLYFGDHHVHGGIRTSVSDEDYRRLVAELRSAFLDRDFPSVMRGLDSHFDRNIFSFKSLFADTQRRILDRILDRILESTPNTDLRRTLTREKVDIDRVRELIDEVQTAKVELDAKGLSYAFERTLERLANDLASDPDNLDVLRALESLATIARAMPFEVDIWQVQNIYFSLLQTQHPIYTAKAAEGDERAIEWTRAFEKLGEPLAIFVGRSDA